MRTLIVDDSPMMRLLLCRILRAAGADVDEAPDGETAVERLTQEERYDCLVVDWNMPGMDGPELIRIVRATPTLEGLPILMVTCENSHDQVSRALLAGADEYLMKPFTPDMLVSKLAMLGFHELAE